MRGRKPCSCCPPSRCLAACRRAHARARCPACVSLLTSTLLRFALQRRRTGVDELNMRTLFEEQDLISVRARAAVAQRCGSKPVIHRARAPPAQAEVQSFFSDGGVALHTRSAKYGRLSRGLLVCVQPVLIKRLKQHFFSLPAHHVDVVLGCNGWVWVQARSRPAGTAVCARASCGLTRAPRSCAGGVCKAQGRRCGRARGHRRRGCGGGSGGGAARGRTGGVGPGRCCRPGWCVMCQWPRLTRLRVSDASPCSALTRGSRARRGRHAGVEAREHVCRVAASVRALAELFLAIHPDAISGVADAALAWGVPPRHMGGAPFLRRLAEREAAKRQDDAATGGGTVEAE
jgi:hypothetical protein